MLALSMRMTRIAYADGGEELRDALAQDWWRFFQAVLPGMPVLPVPNIGQEALDLLRHFPITGLLLTGGDDWGVFTQRDMTETLLYTWAERLSLPVMGVCRGAQVINHLMGGRTETGFEKGHVRTRHSLDLTDVTDCPLPNLTSLEVNSFHRHGIRQEDLASDLRACAFAPDGSVEAFAGDSGRVIGIMWHPEREEKPTEHDTYLMRRAFMREQT